jgi:hypothetical protein
MNAGTEALRWREEENEFNVAFSRNDPLRER